MMERFFGRMVALAVPAVLLISCGGDTPADAVPADEMRVAMTLLAADDTACDDYVGDNIQDKLGALTIRIYDGSNPKPKHTASLTKDKLSGDVTISGIPDVSNARLELYGFEAISDPAPKWIGKVEGLNFVSGKKTNVYATLYPVSGIGCFPRKLQTPRFGHVATTLPDGRILITGGFTLTNNGTWDADDTVELIDVESGTIDQIADMKEFRAFHTVIPLPDGRVLIAGGVGSMKMEKTTVTDYPDLPVTLSGAPAGMEIYTIGLPRKNQRITTTDTTTVDWVEGALDWPSIFAPYQGYAFVRTDETTGSGTLFVVGGAKDGTAFSKIWGIEVTVSEEGTVSAAVNEYHTDKTETFVMPVVAPAGLDNGTPRVLVIGGRKATSTAKFTHIISKDVYEEWNDDTPNIFFGSAAAQGDIIVTANGLTLPKDATAFEMQARGYRFNMADRTYKWGDIFPKSAWFHEVTLDVTEGYNGYFSVIGGAEGFDTTQTSIGATNFYQLIDLDMMYWENDWDPAQHDGNPAPRYGDYFNGSSESDPGRALHRVARSGDLLYITGGLDDDLKSTTLVGTIKLMSTTRPW